MPENISQVHVEFTVMSIYSVVYAIICVLVFIFIWTYIMSN